MALSKEQVHRDLKNRAMYDPDGDYTNGNYWTDMLEYIINLEKENTALKEKLKNKPKETISSSKDAVSSPTVTNITQNTTVYVRMEKDDPSKDEWGYPRRYY